MRCFSRSAGIGRLGCVLLSFSIVNLSCCMGLLLVWLCFHHRGRMQREQINQRTECAGRKLDLFTEMKACGIGLEHPQRYLHRVPIGMLNRYCMPRLSRPGNDLERVINERVEWIVNRYRRRFRRHGIVSGRCLTYISIVFFWMGSIASPMRVRYSSRYVHPPPNSCRYY
jgi:hypothetical protein